MLSSIKRSCDKHLYRCRVSGVKQYSRDVLSVLSSRKGEEKAPAPCLLSQSTNIESKRILYVHSGWAIEQVGRLWFSDVPGLDCLSIHADSFRRDPAIQSEYEVVLFGYTWLMVQLKGLVFGRDIWCVVHDPTELFPESPDWKAKGADSSLLHSLEELERVIVTSVEMEEALVRLGVDVTVVPTDSCLPIRAAQELGAIVEPITVTTVGRVYRRKNFEMYKYLADWAERERVGPLRFRPKWGFVALPTDSYVAFLDGAEICLCTSFQEGGPIPPMDAMRRGQLVLSTPVGQMPERIVDGETGFICRTASEFQQRLRELAGDPGLLESMRLASLRGAARFHEDGTIAHSVAALTGPGSAKRA